LSCSPAPRIGLTVANSQTYQILSLGYNEKRIEWLDYKYDSKKFIPDKEYIGIDFLENTTDYKRLKILGESIGHL
jgi:hypothetical protein